MDSDELQALMRQAEALSPEEQLLLIFHLSKTAWQDYPEARAGRAWSEIQGAAPYPLMGEDAQAWVSRTRREADERREQQFRRTA